MQPPGNVTISLIRRCTKHRRRCGIRIRAILPVRLTWIFVALKTTQPEPWMAFIYLGAMERADRNDAPRGTDLKRRTTSFHRLKSLQTALRQHYCDEFLIEAGCHHFMIHACTNHDMMNSNAILNGAGKRVSFAATGGRSWRSRCLSPASGLSGERSTHISQHAAQTQM